MKECPELLTAEEYNEICNEMLNFQESNNSLTYSEEEGRVANPAGPVDEEAQVPTLDEDSAGVATELKDAVHAHDDIEEMLHDKPVSLVTRILRPFRSP
jgi:hypothetical protein